MDDLMKCLYTFTKDRRMGRLYDDPAYEKITQSVNLQMKKVETGMTKEQLRELNLLLTNISALHSIDEEHFFQAALELAQKLRTLV